MLQEFERLDPLPKRIESKRLAIRQVSLLDAEEIALLHTEAYKRHLAPWSPQPLPHATEAEALEAFKEFTMLALENWQDDLDYRFSIVQKSTGKIVGVIGITNVIRGVSRAAYIGYWIGFEYLNRGYATEATVLAMQYAFECLKLHRVNLWIADDNEPSLRIAEKLGLRYEGTVKQALFLGRQWKGTLTFGMLVEEWQTRRDELQHRFHRD